jgi:hypothetical protein
VIDRTLTVTPLPKRLLDRSPNTIQVSLIAGRYTVIVNGQIESVQPAAASIDRIVVFGSRNADRITVDANVTIPATLNGGTGGDNIVRAGGGPSRLHGWFGRNRLTGGAARDALIGRAGRVRFFPSPGNDLLFAGEPNFRPTGKDGKPTPPTGTFFRFGPNGRLVPLGTPGPNASGRTIISRPRPPADPS